MGLPAIGRHYPMFNGRPWAPVFVKELSLQLHPALTSRPGSSARGGISGCIPEISMNIKIVLPALLALCGAACISPVHAAEYRCMVFSGADGSKVEASTNADGKYLIKAADLKAAEAGALAAATRYKKGSVTLTKAQCDAVTGASATAMSEPMSTTTAPATAPAGTTSSAAGSGKSYYCAVWDADGERLQASSADQGTYKITAADSSAAEDLAVAAAKKQHAGADSAQCETSLAVFDSY